MNQMLPVGMEISDEDGWRIVVAQEADGYWTMDKHGTERFVTLPTQGGSMPKPSDYVWIKKWGQLAGSFAYYIEDEQARAAADNAPINAIYRETGPGGKPGLWRTTDDITSATTRSALGLDPIKEDA